MGISKMGCKANVAHTPELDQYRRFGSSALVQSALTLSVYHRLAADSIAPWLSLWQAAAQSSLPCLRQRHLGHGRTILFWTPEFLRSLLSYAGTSTPQRCLDSRCRCASAAHPVAAAHAPASRPVLRLLPLRFGWRALDHAPSARPCLLLIHLLSSRSLLTV